MLFKEESVTSRPTRKSHKFTCLTINGCGATESKRLSAAIRKTTTKKIMADFKNVQPLDGFDWDSFESGAVATSQSKEQDEKAYTQTLGKVNDNDVVEGKVISINKREVVVSIGFKSDGIVPVSEFRYNPDLKVGDSVEV